MVRRMVAGSTRRTSRLRGCRDVGSLELNDPVAGLFAGDVGNDGNLIWHQASDDITRSAQPDADGLIDFTTDLKARRHAAKFQGTCSDERRWLADGKL